MIKMKMIPNFQNQNLNKRKREKKKEDQYNPHALHCLLCCSYECNSAVGSQIEKEQHNG